MKPRKLIADEDALYQVAVRALARQMRSVAELKRLLRTRVTKEAGAAMIENVVARLKDHKYLNDAAYAAVYSTSRRDTQKLGRARVTAALRNRGVHKEVIEKAVHAAYDGVNEEQLARDFLRRKRIPRPQAARDAARAFRRLARAGFPTSIIVRVLRHWDVDDEVLTALEGEQEP